MNRPPARPAPRRAQPRSESITALVLQGGGALGAYQAGACEALTEAGEHPDWVAGISIGAINAALIAGNPPEQRCAKLQEFWTRVSVDLPSPVWAGSDGPLRSWANDCAAMFGAAFGLPAFFEPRPVATWWPGELPKPSLYDTAPLRHTLLELVDFERLNDGPVRLSLGAVDVKRGNFEYFDNRSQRIGPEHVMASGALPPGFPAISIDGRDYWDGGLVSNTPLSHVVENLDVDSATIFQIDLFSARGELPRTLAEVAEREKDIRFSSRTRAVTDRLRERHELHRRMCALAELLPPARRTSPDVRRILAEMHDPAISLVHIIHRNKGIETQTKDYEFSRTSMREHWQAGRADMAQSLRALADAPPASEPGAFRVFDYTTARPQGQTA